MLQESGRPRRSRRLRRLSSKKASDPPRSNRSEVNSPLPFPQS